MGIDSDFNLFAPIAIVTADPTSNEMQEVNKVTDNSTGGMQVLNDEIQLFETKLIRLPNDINTNCQIQFSRKLSRED